MGVVITKVLGLPSSFRVLELRQSVNHRRDAIVLAERTQHDPLAHANHVVWNVNMIEGGCSGGGYHPSYEEARRDFNKRCARLS